jgi:hypothetical protein
MSLRPAHGDILLVFGNPASAPDFLLVATELRRRGYRCTFGLFGAARCLDTLCDEAGFDSYPVFDSPSPLQNPLGQDASGHQESRGMKATMIALPNGIRQGVARVAARAGAMPLLLQLRRQLMHRTIARTILQSHPWCALILEGDSKPLPLLLLAHTASHMGIPAVAMQTAFLQQPHDLAKRNLRRRHLHNHKVTWLERAVALIIRVLWPRLLQWVDGKAVMPLGGPYTILINALLGILPLTYWLQFGGKASYYALSGSYFKDLLLQCGIPKDKLIVCGQPRLDSFMCNLSYRKCTTKDIRKQLSISASEKLVLIATQDWERDGDISLQEKLHATEQLVASILALGNHIQVVLKIHFQEQAADYEELLQKLQRVSLISEGDIIPLIVACDVFITQAPSTTIFLGSASGKPLITWNFHNAPRMDQFVEMGLSLHVRSPEDVVEALAPLLEGGGPAFLTEARRSVLERFVRLDGCATAAVTNLVERAIHTRTYRPDSTCHVVRVPPIRPKSRKGEEGLDHGIGHFTSIRL